MAEQNKALGLHQRIPLDILAEAVCADLRGEADSDRITQLIRTEYAGENRQKKGVHQIKTTIAMNPVMDFCRGHKDAVLTAMRAENDSKLILGAIIAGRYRFCYEAYCALAKQFRIQDYVNTDLLQRIMGTEYGANKSVVNVQINTLAQMLEAGLIVRVKPGVYKAAEPLVPVYSITLDVWKESYYINEPLASSENEETLLFQPYFKYIDVSRL
ncbi:MAG: hypothetical protein LUE27_11055 [Clostridia bacterium]|nr:hypothetical protein [Clostridia bacterium]